MDYALTPVIARWRLQWHGNCRMSISLGVSMPFIYPVLLWVSLLQALERINEANANAG